MPKFAHYPASCASNKNIPKQKIMINVAIFASGSGSNAENIIRSLANHPHIRIVAVISDRPDAGVHRRARSLGVPSFVFTRAEFELGLPVIAKLRELYVGFIVLAGFLRKISNTILDAYPNQIINIHPALLPKHGGKGMYGMNVHQAVIDAGDKESGITIHYINDEYDAGDIIFRASCPVLPGDTPEQLAKRIHLLEYEHYPRVIEGLLSSMTNQL
jgi:phosphoribosylglycinamide formyltransferase-1